MIPTNNEKYILTLYKRIPNSPYEMEEAPEITFRGRPANNAEKRNYRVQKGVHSNHDSVYVFVSNLPVDIEIGDKVKFLGDYRIVESIGYYYNNSGVVNPSIMTEEYIAHRCPKGITLN